MVKKNSEKKILEEEKEKREKKFNEELQKELVQLIQDKQNIESEIEIEDIEISKYKKSFTFLAEVIQQTGTDEYFGGDIDNVVARYKILKKGNDNLTKQLQDTHSKIESTSFNHAKFVKEKQNDIVTYNNKLLELQIHIEDTQKQIQEDESKEEEIINSANEKIAEWGQVELAIKNLHVRALALKRNRGWKKSEETSDCEDLLNRLE